MEVQKTGEKYEDEVHHVDHMEEESDLLYKALKALTLTNRWKVQENRYQQAQKPQINGIQKEASKSDSVYYEEKQIRPTFQMRKEKSCSGGKLAQISGS